MENHELRRPGDVPFGAAFLSTDVDRDRLRAVGVLTPFVVVAGTGTGTGTVWLFWGVIPLALGGLDSADVDLVAAVCWGCAGAGVLIGGEGGFLLTLSVATSAIQLVSLAGIGRNGAMIATTVASGVAEEDVPLGEACVIQLTSTPWTCSMLGDAEHEKNTAGKGGRARQAEGNGKMRWTLKSSLGQPRWRRSTGRSWNLEVTQQGWTGSKELAGR